MRPAPVLACLHRYFGTFSYLLLFIQGRKTVPLSFYTVSKGGEQNVPRPGWNYLAPLIGVDFLLLLLFLALYSDFGQTEEPPPCLPCLLVILG